MNAELRNTIAGFGPRAEPSLRIGFGCEQLGGHQWGDVDPSEAGAAVSLAAAHGIALFDTADCYGLGESERLLGALLRPMRSAVVIATKFGVRFDDQKNVVYDSSPEWAEVALNQSLKRLRCDYVDLFQLHYWDGRTNLEDLFGTLDRFRESGKCRHLGVTNVPMSALTEPVRRLLRSWSMEYSLLRRESEPQAVEASANGLAVISYGSLGQGLLSGRYGAEHRFPANDRRSRDAYVNFHGDRLRRNQSIVDEVRAAAAALGSSPAQVAIAWVLAQPAAFIPLIGIKREAQFRDVLGALELRLQAEWVERLNRVSQPAPNHQRG